jgi:UDP-glucose 4-epimerase
MRLTVTGGCGFIGSHVVDQLVNAGHDVLVIDKHKLWANPAAEYLIGDVFDDRALEAALDGRDAVFHLAGAADVNDVTARPVDAVRLNIEGTGRVLDAARRRGCARVILASTVWVYGATVGGRAVPAQPHVLGHDLMLTGHAERTEDAPIDLSRSGHLYVTTKLAAEMLMHSYLEMYGQEFTILRYGIPYGPRMRDALVVARFVRAARSGDPITITGTGEQQRNFVYVEDLAEAHVLTLVDPATNQTLALEGDTPLSVSEIAETVQHLVRQVPIRHVNGRPADYDGVSISNRLAKELLNWSPTTPLEEGIRRYLAWLDSEDGRA